MLNKTPGSHLTISDIQEERRLNAITLAVKMSRKRK